MRWRCIGGSFLSQRRFQPPHLGLLHLTICSPESDSQRIMPRSMKILRQPNSATQSTQKSRFKPLWKRITGAPDESGSKRREKGSPKRATHEYARNDSVGLALFAVSEGQWHWPSGIGHDLRALANTANHDRKLWRANCYLLVASGTTGGFSCVRIASGVEGKNLEMTKLSEADEQNIAVSDDDPRWRSPEASHGFETGFENGPPPRSSPPMRMLHHGQVAMDYRIQGCGAMIRARWQASL